MTSNSDIQGFLPLHPEALRILLVLRGWEIRGYGIGEELERDPGRSGRVLRANRYRRIRTLSERRLITETDGPDRQATSAVGTSASPDWARPWHAQRRCGYSSSKGSGTW